MWLVFYVHIVLKDLLPCEPKICTPHFSEDSRFSYFISVRHQTSHSEFLHCSVYSVWQCGCKIFFVQNFGGIFS